MTTLINQESTPYKIKCRGKLPNSSYHDTMTIISPNSFNARLNDSINQSTNGDQLQQQQQQQQPQQQPQQQQQQQIDDTNLYVRCLAFSPDGTHLVWNCGYGLIKIIKWKDSMTRKRTISNESIGLNDSGSNKIQKAFPDQSPTTPLQTQQSSSSLPNSSPISIHSNSKSLNESKTSFCETDRIMEIDCTEIVCSLAFGSSKSCVRNRNLNKQSKVNTRFNFTEQSLLLAVGLISGKIRIYDGISGVFLLGLFDHKERINDLKFTKDGSLQLASCSTDSTIKLWDMLDDGNMYKTLKGHNGSVLAIDWSPTGSLLCSVGINRQAYIWDTKKFTIKHTLRGHLHDVASCEFSPDGTIVATASYDTKICLWSSVTGMLIKQFYHLLPPPSFIYAGGHNGAFVRSIAFSKNGDHLVSICDDKKIRIWSLCSRSMNPIAEGTHVDGISCAYSSDSRTIMIGTRQGYVVGYEVPVMIQRLTEICRKVVNQYIDPDLINRTNIPLELKKFLTYEDIMDKPAETKKPTHTYPKSTISTSNYQSTTLCN